MDFFSYDNTFYHKHGFIEKNPLKNKAILALDLTTVSWNIGPGADFWAPVGPIELMGRLLARVKSVSAAPKNYICRRED